MKVGKIKMPMRKIMENVTIYVDVEVTGLRMFAVRKAIAIALFKFGAWVLGAQNETTIKGPPWTMPDYKPVRTSFKEKVEVTA